MWFHFDLGVGPLLSKSSDVQSLTEGDTTRFQLATFAQGGEWTSNEAGFLRVMVEREEARVFAFNPSRQRHRRVSNLLIATGYRRWTLAQSTRD